MIRTAVYTDVGPRENLEDAALAAVIRGPGGKEIPILIICDGAGGQSLSEMASAQGLVHVHLLLSALITHYLVNGGLETLGPDIVADGIMQALGAANEAVIDCANGQPLGRDMATTVVCGVVVHDTLIFGWAGDSRCYVLSDGHLHLLSRDHSEVMNLLDSGRITLDEAKAHPAAHAITRYLGQRCDFEPQIGMHQLEPDDLILLCTDGLTDALSDDLIAECLLTYQSGLLPFNQLAHHLVQGALDAGTGDNTTVLVCEHRSQPGALNWDESPTATNGYAVAVARTLETLQTGDPYEYRSFTRTRTNARPRHH